MVIHDINVSVNFFGMFGASLLLGKNSIETRNCRFLEYLELEVCTLEKIFHP